MKIQPLDSIHLYLYFYYLISLVVPQNGHSLIYVKEISFDLNLIDNYYGCFFYRLKNYCLIKNCQIYLDIIKFNSYLLDSFLPILLYLKCGLDLDLFKIKIDLLFQFLIYLHLFIYCYFHFIHPIIFFLRLEY